MRSMQLIDRLEEDALLNLRRLLDGGGAEAVSGQPFTPSPEIRLIRRAMRRLGRDEQLIIEALYLLKQPSANVRRMLTATVRTRAQMTDEEYRQLESRSIARLRAVIEDMTSTASPENRSPEKTLRDMAMETPSDNPR